MKRNVAIVMTLVVAVAGLAAYGFSSRVSPVTTTSPKTQGGFTFLRSVRGTIETYPNGQKVSSRQFGRLEPVCTLLWQGPEDKPYLNPFKYHAVLIAENGERQGLSFASELVRDPKTSSGKGCYAYVKIPQGYGTEFVKSSIAIVLDGNELGRWKLTALPKPKRGIAKKDATVLSSKLGPLDVDLTPGRFSSENGEYDALDLGLHLKGKLDSTREYYLWTYPGRTTWSRPLFTGGDIGMGLGKNRDFHTFRALPFCRDMEQIEILAKLTESRVYSETIRVQGLKLVWHKPDPDARPTPAPSLELVPDGKPFEVVTPSGIRFALKPIQPTIRLDEDGAVVEVWLSVEPGDHGITLPNSPLYKSVGKPVDLVLTPRDANNQIMLPSRGAAGSVFFGMRLSREQFKPGPLPEFTVEVKQTVQVNEWKTRFLGPVVQVLHPPHKLDLSHGLQGNYVAEAKRR